jgi:hypothetical protein
VSVIWCCHQFGRECNLTLRAESFFLLFPNFWLDREEWMSSMPRVFFVLAALRSDLRPFAQASRVGANILGMDDAGELRLSGVQGRVGS